MLGLLKSALAVALVFSIGCTKSSLVSQRDPAARDASFGKIVIEAALFDLELRKECEQEIVRDLVGKGYGAVAAVDILFPGRQYSSEQIDEIVADNQIDAWLLIGATGSGYSSTYVPQTSTTNSTATVWGNTITGSSRTTTTGGYNVDKPWASFEVSLLDLGRGEIIWYATIKTKGNAFASDKDLVRGAGGKIASEIEKEKILRPRE